MAGQYRDLQDQLYTLDERSTLPLDRNNRRSVLETVPAVPLLHDDPHSHAAQKSTRS